MFETMKPFLTQALAAFLVLALTAADACAQTTTIKLATIIPEQSSWVKQMRAATSEIQQRTDSRVKFKLYTGGVMGTQTQVRRKMRIGQLHGGAFTGTELAAFQRDAQLWGLPMLFENMQEAAYVRKYMDPELRQRLEDAGYVNFGYAGGGFAYLMSNQPVRSLQDLKQLKVWIPEGDRSAYAASKALGLPSVTLPMTDVLTGLQTGLIDTLMSPPIGAIVMQWNTAVKYITDLPIAYVNAMLVIDARIFNRIAKPDQAIVREVMERLYRKYDQEGVTEDKKAMQALIDDGMQLIEPERGQVPKWSALVRASNRKLARNGLLDEKLLDQVDCYLAAYRTQQEPVNCSP